MCPVRESFSFPLNRSQICRGGEKNSSRMSQVFNTGMLFRLLEMLEKIFFTSVLRIWINIFQKWTFSICLYLHQIQRWKVYKLTLMVLSADPVTNHWLPGSTAMDLTQPRWPLMTCHRKHNTAMNKSSKKQPQLEKTETRAEDWMFKSNLDSPETVSTEHATVVWAWSALSSSVRSF